MYSKIDKATDYLRKYLKFTPDVVIVLNSSLDNLHSDMPVCEEIPFESIPGFVSTNDPARKSCLYYGVLENKNVLLLAGKPFFFEGKSVDDFMLPYRVFANLGIKNIIFTTSCGAINPDYKVGDVILFEDHISLFAPNVLSGETYTRFGSRLVDMSTVYTPSLIKRITDSLNTDENTKLKLGTYCYTVGPNYETKADIKALSVLGADMVGMATVPEAMICHHAGMNVIGLALITNLAAGLAERPLSFREIVLNGRISEAKEKSILKKIVHILPKE